MKQLVIKGVQLIDVETGAVAEKSVVVENGLVTDILDTCPEVESEKVIDGTGLYLMPGFINCHTHLAWDGSKTDIMLQSKYDNDAISAFKYAANMKKCLDVGLTTVRDLGMNMSNIYAKQAVDRGIIESPRLYISGQATPGGAAWRPTVPGRSARPSVCRRRTAPRSSRSWLPVLCRSSPWKSCTPSWRKATLWA